MFGCDRLMLSPMLSVACAVACSVGSVAMVAVADTVFNLWCWHSQTLDYDW